MARNEKDTAKAMQTTTDVSAPVKTSKFKFNKPTSRLQLQTNTDENRTLNTIEKTTSAESAVKKADDCVIISDEDSPIKSVTMAKKITAPNICDDDDFFGDFKSNDLTYVRPPTKAKSEVKTMEDLYAKYGSPNANKKTTFDTMDIDKELNSNVSYVNAMKKLDENMERLKTSPKKTVTTSKFKFNSRSKPANTTNQNTTQISDTSNTSSTSSFELSSTIATSNKTATVTSGAFSSSASSLLSSSISNFTANSTVTTTNKFSPVNTSQNRATPTNTTSQTSSSSTGSYKPESATPISPVDNSFKLNDSP